MSEKGTPTEEQAGAVGNGKNIMYDMCHRYSHWWFFITTVTNKVTAGAKSFGSFLSGVVNKAGDKIKETVKHNVSYYWIQICSLLWMWINYFPQPILGDFNKEQEAFIKDQSGKNTDAGVCPWIGHKNEEKIKDEVLSLSSVSCGLYAYRICRCWLCV